MYSDRWMWRSNISSVCKYVFGIDAVCCKRSHFSLHNKAASWQSQHCWMCAWKRLRSVWSSAQSDKSTCSTLCGQLGNHSSVSWTAKTLIRRPPSLTSIIAGLTCHFVGFVSSWVNLRTYLTVNHAQIQRGWQGVWTPSLKNHKSIGFLSNTGPDPLKNHKATKLAFNVWPSSWWPTYCGICILTPIINKAKTKQNKRQSWTPSDITFWIRAWYILPCRSKKLYVRLRWPGLFKQIMIYVNQMSMYIVSKGFMIHVVHGPIPYWAWEVWSWLRMMSPE